MSKEAEEKELLDILQATTNSTVDDFQGLAGALSKFCMTTSLTKEEINRILDEHNNSG